MADERSVRRVLTTRPRGWGLGRPNWEGPLGTQIGGAHPMITAETSGGAGGKRGDSTQHGARGTTGVGHTGTVGAHTGPLAAPAG
jgi:hypothetical protein